MKTRRIIYIFILVGSIFSCKETNVGNIELRNSLVQNQGVNENKELAALIKKVLMEDKSSLEKLIDFPCGNALGCYDKGFILTQLIYEIGEQKFQKLINQFDKASLNKLAGLIDVGLEYGHKLNLDAIEVEFEQIRKFIEERNENIEFLRLSYNEVKKYNCLYSKSEGEFLNKNFHLAINSDDKIAFVKLKSENDRIKIPLLSSKKLNSHQEFEEEYLFRKGAIVITLKTISEKSNTRLTKKYSNEVIIRDGNEVSNYKMISYCKE